MRALCFVLLTACATTAPATQPSASASSWPDLSNDFIETWLKHNPDDAVGAGRHEYDGQLPDLSEAGFQKQLDDLKAISARVEAFPTDGLPPEQAREREYARAVLKRQLFWLETMRWYRVSPM